MRVHLDSYSSKSIRLELVYRNCISNPDLFCIPNHRKHNKNNHLSKKSEWRKENKKMRVEIQVKRWNELIVLLEVFRKDPRVVL